MLKTPTMVAVKARQPTPAQRVASNQLLRSQATNLPAPIRAAAATLARLHGTGGAAAGRGATVNRPRVAPGIVGPIVNGAMPRKQWVSPKVAVPPRPRMVGAAGKIPSVFDRLTRGRVQQRATR